MQKDFTRNNHYLPEFYLKAWAGSDRKVFVYPLLVPDEKVPTWSKKGLRRTGSVKDLYTSSLSADDSDDFERWLSTNIEDDASQAIAHALSGERRLSRSEWTSLVRFYALQEARTPARLSIYLRPDNIERFDRMFRATVTKSIADLERKIAAGERMPRSPTASGPQLPFRLVTAPNEGESTGLIRGEVAVGREAWLHSIYTMATRTYKALLRHKWTLLSAPNGHSWVTSDHPTVGHLNGKFFGLDSSIGWLTPGVELFMPLSPKLLLYTKSGHSPKRKHMPVTSQEASRINDLIILRAHLFIISDKVHAQAEKLRPRTINLDSFRSHLAMWNSFNTSNRDAIESLGRPITDDEIASWRSAG